MGHTGGSRKVSQAAGSRQAEVGLAVVTQEGSLAAALKALGPGPEGGGHCNQAGAQRAQHGFPWLRCQL